MKYAVRPLQDRDWLRTGPRHISRFDSTWTSTTSMMGRELRHLGATEVVIMCDCTEADLRIDGQLRANARLASPAVAIAFESTKGPLQFRCDRYISGPYRNSMLPWQHNVRAIALTLEALRAVDRYGATSSGQQYTGYRQIEARSTSLKEAQETLLIMAEGLQVNVGEPIDWPRVLKLAVRATHPDLGGSTEAYATVMEAGKVLGLTR